MDQISDYAEDEALDEGEVVAMMGSETWEHDEKTKTIAVPSFNASDLEA